VNLLLLRDQKCGRSKVKGRANALFLCACPRAVPWFGEAAQVMARRCSDGSQSVLDPDHVVKCWCYQVSWTAPWMVAISDYNHTCSSFHRRLLEIPRYCW
jgi:hypothetical protein